MYYTLFVDVSGTIIERKLANNLLDVEQKAKELYKTISKNYCISYIHVLKGNLTKFDPVGDFKTIIRGIDGELYWRKMCVNYWGHLLGLYNPETFFKKIK